MDTSPSTSYSRLFVRINGIECAHCVEALTRAIGAVLDCALARPGETYSLLPKAGTPGPRR